MVHSRDPARVRAQRRLNLHTRVIRTVYIIFYERAGVWVRRETRGYGEKGMRYYCMG